jgi:DNA-binding PadR family transcriptional regulator
LIPRGGGNFLAQMDGNLTLWKHDDNLATLHHLDKWRGPGFEPITFKLEKITTEKLVDSKDRQLPTIHAVAITAAEEEEQEASTEYDENRLLVALAGKKPLSIADLAQRCGWLLANGEPHKSKIDRILRRLQTDGLVKRVRGRKYRLTDKGRQELGAADDDEITKTVEDRSGAVGSKKPFHALRGMKQRETVPCAYCGRTGDVYKFADGRLPKGQRHHADLHAEHAEPFFTGQPTPEPADDNLDPDLN